MKQSLQDKLDRVADRHEEVGQLLSDPEVIGDQNRFRELSMEYSDLEDVVRCYRQYREQLENLETARAMLEDSDPDMREMGAEEVEAAEQRVTELDAELQKLMLPKDPHDNSNVYLEIRAGTGGDEAALFAADLFRMYSRYAEGQGWKVEVLSDHPTGGGGFKEIIAMIQGRGAYSRMKYESGTHRVQRVPATETQGRIHTSAVTVAVLPEAEEVDVAIDPSELKIDVYRSTGPGGQSVNTTDSAVRITHLPTGLVVTCQDEKSQIKNKAKALKVLRARLLDQVVREQDAQRSAERKNQIGDGDRSGRIRTYNFPQGRVTDHRIGLTLYKLEEIMQGEVDPVIDELISHFQAQALQDEAS
jgi:peptide chain release factor 1